MFSLGYPPPKFNGFGIEAEGRDLNFNRPSGVSKMRQDTGLAGLIYSMTHFKNSGPMGKFLVGIGSIDFPPVGSPPYTHDTFMVLAPGEDSISGSGNMYGCAAIMNTSSGTTPSMVIA